MPKKTKWRRRTMAAIAVLALAPVIPGILLAEAHSFTAPTSVTIVYSVQGQAFHGRVSSTRDSCLGGRTVNLFKTQPGTDLPRGTTTTGPQGGWKVDRGHASGTFYAVVLRSESGGYGGSHVCLRGRSANLTV